MTTSTTDGAKTLYIDIETSPNVADVWGLWNQNVSLNQLRESSRVISFAAKWRGETKKIFRSEFHDGREAMLNAAWILLSQADVVVHWNGRKFDVPTLNKEFVIDRFGPPAPFIQLDLMEVTKRNFRFPSNKLQYVADVLLGTSKTKHEGHEMWVKCLAGDSKAWAQMKKYNIQDVVLLEDIHDVLLPWITGGLNARLYTGHGCPACGEDTLQRRGFTWLRTGQYQRYVCTSCRSWSRDTRRIDGTDIVGIGAGNGR